MSAPISTPAEELIGGTGRPPRRWPLLLLVAAGLAAAVVALVVQRHRSAEEARRVDEPTLRVLTHLAAQGAAFDPSAANLTVSIDRADEEPLPPIRVQLLQLAAGAMGPVHAVVIDHYQGSGPGPLLEHVSPFTAEAIGIRIDLTFTHPAQCGHPLAGDPPLLVDVTLPSGRNIRLKLRITGVVDPYGEESVNGPHVPWPRALAQLACQSVSG